jgi:hypothetical protein
MKQATKHNKPILNKIKVSTSDILQKELLEQVNEKLHKKINRESNVTKDGT